LKRFPSLLFLLQTLHDFQKGIHSNAEVNVLAIRKVARHNANNISLTVRSILKTEAATTTPQQQQQQRRRRRRRRQKQQQQQHHHHHHHQQQQQQQQQ
jgi:hypothetical protein